MTSDLIAYFAQQQDETLALLKALVEHESFSADKPHVDALADFIAAQCAALQASSVTRYPQTHVGDMLLAKWNEHNAGKPILILVHMDTVHPVGTLSKNAWRIDEQNRLYGAGVLDMKSGIAVALAAIKGLQARGEMPSRPIYLLATSDEEIGSQHSEPLIREIAAQCGLALVMEFPTTDGALKTGRKGVATYDLYVTGKASHAGNHPEEGINAILEMAQQIVSISKLQNLRAGISVAVNVIAGGTASNIIAPSAHASIDVRTITQYDMDSVHEELMSVQPKIPGAQVEMQLHHMREPMERNELMARTFEQCQQIAKSIGLSVSEDFVGGGSDGNITAGMGVPTLDGLGVQGKGAHTLDEHILLKSVPERSAHIAALLRDWQF